jgi:hypothetical protein
METTRRGARRELLRRLLDGYERSRAFGRPGPWARDVIVKLEADEFPDAFAPDGREALAAVRGAAEELSGLGAARIDRATGWSDGEPRTLRLGPGELARAYELAEDDGYQPLSRALAQLAEHAERLADGTTSWMGEFLGRVAEAARRGELKPLGMQGERFKREWRDLLQAMTAAARLASGAAGWERVVSEAIFGNSKRLAALRGRVVDLLLRADPRWDGWAPDDAQDVLEAYGVRRKPGLLVCAGCAELRLGAREYRLEDFRPVAHLPDGWAAAWVEGVTRSAATRLTTIENEVPFLSYVEERGGPASLGDGGELVVYTAGFPTPALLQALADVCVARPELAVRHWGDADLGGLRIWWHLRQRLDRPVALFRADRAWLDSELAARAGTPLTAGEHAALERLRRDLDRGAQSLAPDVGQALALLDGLLTHGMKLEQERN